MSAPPASPGPSPSAAATHAIHDAIPAFETLSAEYCAAWGLCCVLADANGHVVAHTTTCGETCELAADCARERRRSIREALRWGEPTMQLCRHGMILWAVPVMHNALLLGGVVSVAPDPSQAEGDPFLTPSQIHQAAQDLLAKAEDANLTNGALLELRRAAAQLESRKAEAIHALKDRGYHSLRDVYIVEEPALIAAIKRGDRPAAREIINRILVGVYFMGRERPELLKSLLLELVVMMSRSAVEAGGDPGSLLGANYSSFSELARLEGEEQLCAWLVSMLERIMDAIHTHHSYPIAALVGAAVQYMEEHLGEDISRDDVAKVACLSPAHFSRVVKQTFGQSFTDLLTQMRVDRAREMLALSESSLIRIALECGFSDQSYFTKVFKKLTGQTPGEYRRSRVG